ncbi:MAG: YihY/virulence factor BrkB family protein [Acidimicrobiia bacterium]
MQLHPKVKEWLSIANDVRIESDHDNVVIVAAGVAFYAVLALLPGLFISVSLYGLFTDLATAERQIEALLEVLPQATMVFVEQQMRAVADSSHAGLSIGFVASIAALAWTVSNLTRALVRAVKIAYDQETERSILENRAVAIALTFATLIILIVSLAIIAAAPILLGRLDPTNAIVTFGNLRWLLIGIGVFGGITLLYRYAPPRRPSWPSVIPGTVLATIMWVVTSLGFSIYVSSFGSYNETYGTLGAGVVLLLWFWFSALSIVLGAELNAALLVRSAEHSATADSG